METIYKYVLPVDDTAVIEIPLGSKILSVAFQGEDLCLWAIVTADSPSRPPVRRTFHVRGTGHPADGIRHKSFLGTAFHPAGLVFHVFEG